MNIPEKCKDCAFFKLDNLKNTINCMLGHNLEMAAGCPNKKLENYKNI